MKGMNIEQCTEHWHYHSVYELPVVHYELALALHELALALHKLTLALRELTFSFGPI